MEVAVVPVYQRMYISFVVVTDAKIRKKSHIILKREGIIKSQPSISENEENLDKKNRG